jgi:hypothetical protein
MTTVETVPAVTAESGAHPQLALLIPNAASRQVPAGFAGVALAPRFRGGERWVSAPGGLTRSLPDTR